jgi:hypothetical protein
MMRRLRCLFRRHQWGSEYDHESRRTTWECRRCGAKKFTSDDLNKAHPEIFGAG